MAQAPGPERAEVIYAVQIGQMVFITERQIRGWRFVAMGVLGVDGRMSVIRDDSGATIQEDRLSYSDARF